MEPVQLSNMTSDPSKANSALANLMTCRFVYTSEPDKKINPELIKRLSGRDPIATRKEFQQASKPKLPHFTIFIQCNTTPDFVDDSDGLTRRLVVFDFKSRFVVNTDTAINNVNIFPINTQLVNNFPKWRMSLFHILKDYYYKYKVLDGKSLSSLMPESVKIRSKTLISDSAKEWYDERVVYSEGSLLRLKDVKQDYINWMGHNKSDEKPIQLKVLKTKINKFCNKICIEQDIIRTPTEEGIKVDHIRSFWKDLKLVEN
jgi:hypothetical protein